MFPLLFTTLKSCTTEKPFHLHFIDAAYYDANSYYNAEFVEQANFLKQPWQTVKGLPELEYAFWTVGENKLGFSIPSDRVISQVMPYTSELFPFPLWLLSFFNCCHL